MPSVRDLAPLGLIQFDYLYAFPKDAIYHGHVV